MFNLIFTTTADNNYGGYASGIDEEQLFKFLFFLILIISLILIAYIIYLKYKINKLESKKETSKS